MRFRCGFATQQGPYNEAFHKLFQALERCEEILSSQQFLVSDLELTEADVRLFQTLVRFDDVYVVYFKTNKKFIREYPALSDYVKRVYRYPGGWAGAGGPPGQEADGQAGVLAFGRWRWRWRAMLSHNAPMKLPAYLLRFNWKFFCIAAPVLVVENPGCLVVSARFCCILGERAICLLAAGMSKCVNRKHIKTHYFTSHPALNTYAIIPLGGDAWWQEPPSSFEPAAAGQ